MSVILGIDPGSQTTGFGVIQSEGKQVRYLNSGCIRVARWPLAERLQRIFFGLREVIQEYQPNEVAIEQIFMHQNPNSALKLGQARGVAIVAATCGDHGVLKDKPPAEYSARQVKQSVVGYGAADKTQVQEMVRYLLQLKTKPAPDAADALAIALCHAHHLQNRRLITKKGVASYD